VSTTALAFALGALVSLGSSWLLVSRLERIGDRLGLSEALLGLFAALAADAPEITAAVTAMVRGEHQVGAGVVVGSNVFNLAALLGLSAIVAGGIALHRRVVLLSGTVAIWIAGTCVAALLGIAPAAALAVALAAFVPYGALLGTEGRGFRRLPLPRTWRRWLAAAVAEEEEELEGVIDRVRGTSVDVAVAALSLLLVVGGSVAMESAASALGRRDGLPEIVVGGLVLAAVTSMPNAVAALYLSTRGRGAAVLSTALNSNALNVVVGLLIPATIFGLGAPSGDATLAGAWYAGLTIVALALAWGDRALRRGAGGLIVAAYVVFVASLLETVRDVSAGPRIAVAGAALVALAAAIRPVIARIVRALEGRDSLLPGWSVHRLWALGVALSAAVAIADALLGSRVILIGLIGVGPCCVLLTGRWVPTALTAVWAVGLAALLGLPDDIWATQLHLTFLTAVATVALASIAAAFVAERRRA
jgi:cation:H+ antiporter